MEEEMEMNDSAAEENKKVKAKNNKEEEEAFRELETPEDLGMKSGTMKLKNSQK